MQQDLVSVIMPSFNTGTIIRDSIVSVLTQTYHNLELLITDDNSTDPETIGILKEYAEKDARVKVFFLNANGGAGKARNNSIKHAKGRYIAFCDSDDMWMSDKLEKQIAFMKEHKCCLSFSSYNICLHDGRLTNKVVKAPAILTLREEKHDNKIGCLTAVYDTAHYGKFYMPELRKRQDWALFLTIMKTCGVAYGIAEPLAIYRKVPGSISSNKMKLVKYNAEVYKTVFGYSTVKAYIYLIFVFLPSYFTKRMKTRKQNNNENS